MYHSYRGYIPTVQFPVERRTWRDKGFGKGPKKAGAGRSRSAYGRYAHRSLRDGVQVAVVMLDHESR